MRRISLPAHELLELVAGLALVACGFALDLGSAGTALTLTAGALLAGLGLGIAGGLPPLAHRSLDRALATALAVAAVIAAAGGGALAAWILLATAAAELALTGATRWTRPRLAR